jgi:hypothetical protein
LERHAIQTAPGPLLPGLLVLVLLLQLQLPMLLLLLPMLLLLLPMRLLMLPMRGLLMLRWEFRCERR